jgi:dynein heavy chain
MYIFGGYGGQGYSRRDFDDLYALNVDDLEWTKIYPKGKVPQRRSGHQSCAVDTRMFVFGGWNCAAQFNDLHIFDTTVITWSSVDGTHMFYPMTRWNHASAVVMAIPDAKIFCFGGAVGQPHANGASLSLGAGPMAGSTTCTR